MNSLGVIYIMHKATSQLVLSAEKIQNQAKVCFLDIDFNTSFSKTGATCNTFKSINHHYVHFKSILYLCIYYNQHLLPAPPHTLDYTSCAAGSTLVGNCLLCLVAKKKGLTLAQIKRELKPFQLNLSSGVHNFRQWQVMKVKG